MGFKDLITDALYRVDILSTTASFRTRKQPYYETIAGGLFSIIIMGVFIYFLYIHMLDMFQKLDITYTDAEVDEVTSTSTITSFPFAIFINGVDLSALPRKFMVNLHQNKIVSTLGNINSTSTSLNLSPCSISDWIKYGQSFQHQFYAFNFNEMLCIENGQNISLAGYAGSEVYEYLTFSIFKCNQTLDVNCDTSTNIDAFMTDFVRRNDYFDVRLFVVDTIVTPTNEVAVSYMLEKNIFLGFSPTMGTVGYIKISQFSLQTDTSLLPFNSYETEPGTYIDKFVSNAISLSTTRYIKFDVFRSTKSLTISRTIGKIDTVLSYVGGLFSLIFTAIAFFLGSYSQYKYELYVGSSILSDEEGKKITDDDLSFKNYFFYCCYDWLDTFGIAPTCFSSLKKIHEMREESCEQLDPTLILKRIKYLEDANKTLMSQHRQMCLYLSQPMTVQQAKRMRTSLLYYDNILNDYESNKISRRISVNDDKIFALRSNAIQNQSEIFNVKQEKKQEQQELSEDEEKRLLGQLLYDSLIKLEEDSSEIAKMIKDKIPQSKRKWILERQRQFEFTEMTTMQNNNLQMNSPVNQQVREEIRIQNLQLDKEIRESIKPKFKVIGSE